MKRSTILAGGLMVALASTWGCAGSSPSLEEEYTTGKKARAHYGMAIEHLREGRSAQAIRELQAALVLEPEDPWIHLSLAEAYRRRGRPEEAETHLREAVSLRPGFQPGLLNLSALMFQVGNYQETIELSDQLIDDPTFPVPWKALANRGWAEYKLSRTSEARSSFELALEFDEDHVPALLGLGVVNAEQGRRLEALRSFERVLSLDSGPLAQAEANYRIGEVYVALGNRSKAMHHLAAAAEARPSGEWGRRSEDYLRRLR